MDYDEVLRVRGEYLFWKIPIFPAKKKEKKPGKGKVQAEVKPDTEVPAASVGEEAAPEAAEAAPAAEAAAGTDVAEIPPAAAPEAAKPAKSKPKGKNPFVIFYENTGFDGVMNLLHRTMDALGGLFRGIFRHIVVRELYLDLRVTGGDAADTAIHYGKVCQKVYPTLGYICTNMRVHDYYLEINPDFLGGKDKASYHLKLSMRPLPLLGVLLLAVLRLAVRVLLKFIIKSRPPKSSQAKKGGTPAAGAPAAS